MSARHVSVNGDKSRALCLRLLGIRLSSFVSCAGADRPSDIASSGTDFPGRL